MSNRDIDIEIKIPIGEYVGVTSESRMYIEAAVKAHSGRGIPIVIKSHDIMIGESDSVRIEDDYLIVSSKCSIGGSINIARSDDNEEDPKFEIIAIGLEPDRAVPEAIKRICE